MLLAQIAGVELAQEADSLAVLSDVMRELLIGLLKRWHENLLPAEFATDAFVRSRFAHDVVLVMRQARARARAVDS